MKKNFFYAMMIWGVVCGHVQATEKEVAPQASAISGWFQRKANSAMNWVASTRLAKYGVSGMLDNRFLSKHDSILSKYQNTLSLFPGGLGLLYTAFPALSHYLLTSPITDSMHAFFGYNQGLRKFTDKTWILQWISKQLGSSFWAIVERLGAQGAVSTAAGSAVGVGKAIVDAIPFLSPLMSSVVIPGGMYVLSWASFILYLYATLSVSSKAMDFLFTVKLESPEEWLSRAIDYMRTVDKVGVQVTDGLIPLFENPSEVFKDFLEKNHHTLNMSDTVLAKEADFKIARFGQKFASLIGDFSENFYLQMKKNYPQILWSVAENNAKQRTKDWEFHFTNPETNAELIIKESKKYAELLSTLALLLISCSRYTYSMNEFLKQKASGSIFSNFAVLEKRQKEITGLRSWLWQNSGFWAKRLASVLGGIVSWFFQKAREIKNMPQAIITSLKGFVANPSVFSDQVLWKRQRALDPKVAQDVDDFEKIYLNFLYNFGFSPNKVGDLKKDYDDLAFIKKTLSKFLKNESSPFEASSQIFLAQFLQVLFVGSNVTKDKISEQIKNTWGDKVSQIFNNELKVSENINDDGLLINLKERNLRLRTLVNGMLSFIEQQANRKVIDKYKQILKQANPMAETITTTVLQKPPEDLKNQTAN